jgi:hypothetical protein
MRSVKLFARRQPSSVRQPLDRAALHERFEVDSQFSFGRYHAAQWPEFSGNRRQSRRVRLVGYDVANSDTAPSLLQRELAHVRKDQRELLLVIGA